MTNVDDLAARFDACQIPRDEWTHRAHLLVGAWHVHRYGRREALARLRIGIRRLNESHGTVNSPAGGYHETITAAYVQLLAEFLDGCPSAMPLTQCVARLIEGPLVSKDLLLQFYSRERLMSAVARAEWVEPDLAPLRAGG